MYQKEKLKRYLKGAEFSHKLKELRELVKKNKKDKEEKRRKEGEGKSINMFEKES